MSGSSTD